MTGTRETALHLAAKGGHREVCALLLRNTHLPLTGATAGDKDGRIPWMFAPSPLRRSSRT